MASARPMSFADCFMTSPLLGGSAENTIVDRQLSPMSIVAASRARNPATATSVQ
jgi:hypothetical protein